MSATLTASKVITPVVHRDNGRVEIEYKAEFDGNLVGFFPTNAQAENELNTYVLDLCEQGLVDRPLGLLAEQALQAASPPHADPDPSEPSPDLVDNDDGLPNLPNMRGAHLTWNI